MRRMLNQLGLPPIKIWQQKPLPPSVSQRERLQLTPDFNAHVEFWRLLLEGALGSPVCTLHAPLYSFCSQSYPRTQWSGASGYAMRGYCLESGAWWRVDFDEGVRNRLRQKVEARDDRSINVLELFGIVLTAWAFTNLGAGSPQHARGTVLKGGDHMPTGPWDKNGRSGTSMRMMGCLETVSGWRFQAKHVRGG